MPPSLTLKQRLAALTASPSSPSTPLLSPDRQNASQSQINPPPRNSSLKKGIFNATWTKPFRPADENDAFGTPYAMEKVQEVMNNVIYQAGVDYETRPIVVMNASALPDPTDVSYDILLAQILSYLDLFVESDYTVIFFAAGCQHTPSRTWIWKAYRSLSRKYRKNLKRLLIVHTTLFYKTLFSLAGAIISPKFFRKITYINTLSELACHVPLTQIDIPPAVYHENLKHEQQIKLPTPVRANVFGVSLEELMGFDGEKDALPRVVRDCIQFLRETGLEEEGLFRRSPSSALLRQVQEAYDRGQTVSLRSFGDPHLAAVLIKKFLRDLPNPIFPESTYNIIRHCPLPNDDQSDVSCPTYIRTTILTELSPCAYILLSSILHLMHDVSMRSSKNLMDAHNLAIVVCPNLVSSGNPVQDVVICAVAGSNPTPFNTGAQNIGQMSLGTVIKICIQQYFEIFDEVRDRSEAVPPLDAEATSNSSSVSSSPVPGKLRLGVQDDDDSIDDAMLVMPLGPSNHHHGTPNSSSANATAQNFSGLQVPYKPRQKRSASKPPSNMSTSRSARSLHTTSGKSNGISASNSVIGTMSKAKSLLSIDKGSSESFGKKGTLTVGKGTGRKASGSGVTAISVTAAGFFTPPSTAPPVPPIPPSFSRNDGS